MNVAAIALPVLADARLPRFRKALEQKSDVAEKWAFVFNNIAQLNAIPKELSENCFQRLFESAKIANFTPDERVNYLENQKMRFDYENVMEYAKEQARDEGLAEGRAKGLAEGRAEGKREMAKNFYLLEIPLRRFLSPPDFHMKKFRRYS